MRNDLLMRKMSRYSGRNNRLQLLKYCFIGLLLLSFASAAVAQVTLSLPTQTASSGASLSLPVSVTGFNGIGSFSLTISFDKTVLTYTGVTYHSSVSGVQSTAIATANANGSIAFTWFSLSALNIGSGNLMNLGFTYNGGTSALNFTGTSGSSVTDALGNPLSPLPTFTNGQISAATGPVPVVTTTAATSVTTTGAQVNGTVNPSGSSTTYYFQYGLTTGYGSQTPTSSPISGSTAASVSATLATLTPGTLYHYRIVATNAGGTVQGSDLTFTTTAQQVVAPTVTTTAATSVASAGAQLNGTVNPNGAATTYYFEYGVTTSYGTQTTAASAGAGSAAAPVSATLTGLTASTLYHYRVVAQNSAGTSQGSDMTFTTSATGSGGITLNLPMTTAAIGSSISVPITVTSFNNIGSISLKVAFDKNVLTYTGNSSAPPGTNFTSVSQANTDGAVTISWFSLTALNIGSGTLLNLAFTYNGGTSPLTFTNITSSSITDALASNLTATYNNGQVSVATTPIVTTVAATNIVSNGAQLNGTVNPNGGTASYYFEYGTTTSYGSQTTTASAGSGSSAIAVSAGVSSLSPGTLYHYRIAASSSSGTSQGSDLTFTTATAPSGSQLALILPDTVALTGSSISIPISVNAFNNVGSISLKVAFDKNVLTYAGNSGAPAGTNFTSASQANTDGAVSISWFSLTALNLGSGTLLYLNFTYNGGTSPLTFTFTSSSITDALAANVPAAYVNGRVRDAAIVTPAPAAPVLVSPANLATGASINPTLSWNASTGALTYRVQLSTSQTFATTLVDDSTLTATSKAITGLTNNTVYYWRVSAKSLGGTSAFSATQSFTTIVAAPAVPSLTTPADAATGVAVSTTLTWGTVTGATTYRVQLSSSSTFATVLLDDSTLATTSKAVGPLSNNTTYYWRVSATNAGGTSAYPAARSFTTIVAAPAVPSLTTPADAATGVAVSTTLTWGAVTGATTYRVQLSTSSTFATVLLDDSTLTTTSKAVGPLSNNTTYYWRVSAANAGGTSAYSTARSFTTIVAAPGVPALISPADAATGVAVSTTLTWGAVTGATTYRVQLSASSTFATLLLDDSTLAATSKAVGPLSNNTTYYWRVSATNAGGTSAYSTARSFTTIVATPGVPPLTAPADAATGVAISTTLTWGAVTGATAYRVQLSTSQTFATVLLDDSTATTTSKAVGPLSNNTTYYWRVSATNAGGTSAYSAARSFTTIVAAPAVPSLTSPADAATGVAVSTTLTWGAVTGATTYRVQLSTSQTFATVLLDDSTLATTSKAVGPLSNSTTYYWRVSATNAGGTSAYATARSFTTIVAAPAVPSLTSPADAATGVAVSTTLTWGAVTGATTYRVQLSTSQTFATVLLDDSTLTTTSKAVGPLSNNTAYYWRVSAMNVAGTSAYSTARSFTTIVALPSVPTLASPADSAINLQLTTTLSWNAATGATGYHLQVSTSATFASTVVDDSALTTTTRSVSSLALNTTYYWRVRSKNAAGYSAYSNARNFKTIRTTSVEQLDGVIPTEYALSQNYPNPFNPTTTIQYALPVSGFVTLRLYDVLGREVMQLVDQYQNAGNYIVRVNARTLPSGMYLYELRSESFVQTKRMILEK